MSTVCKTNTTWEVSEDGDLMRLGSGMDYWKNVDVMSFNFPMDAKTVASLMRRAFSEGMDAKSDQIKTALGVFK